MAFRKQGSGSTTDQLKADLHHLTQTIEDLVSATADDSSREMKDLRQRAEKRLKEARARIEARGEKAYDEAREHLSKHVDTCDKYVHAHPWTGVGIGAAIGVVIGLIIGRR